MFNKTQLTALATLTAVSVFNVNRKPDDTKNVVLEHDGLLLNSPASVTIDNKAVTLKEGDQVSVSPAGELSNYVGAKIEVKAQQKKTPDKAWAVD